MSNRIPPLTVAPNSAASTPMSHNNASDTMSNSATQASSPNSMDKKMKRKRNRIPLSCTICRKRKVKCDKIRPHCNQCTKTGVAHLCHYMEQSWAEEAEKELSKESELKNLRERVKYLEKTLTKIHSTSNSNTVANTPDNMITSPASNSSHIILNDTNNNLNGLNNQNLGITVGGNHPSKNNPKDKYDNDELDLTKQFDMLHIKNNGTIHLGATHWLAIMKGDPYLKLLWGHIFNIRERVNDWYSQRLIVNKHSKKIQTLPQNMNKCPVDYKKIQAETQENTASNNAPPITQNSTKSGSDITPPHPLPAGSDGDIRKCPVAHRFAADKASAAEPTEEPTSLPVAPHPLPDGSDGDIKKCPVAHRFMNNIAVKDEEKAMDETMPNYYVKKSGEQEETSTDTAQKTLPSFKKLTSKCLPTDANKNTHPSKLPKKNTEIATNIQDTMTYDQIIDAVTASLPPRNIIFLFVDKFFKHIYPIIPIIDELNFKNHLNQILTESPTNPNSIELKLTKSSDYCNLGIMIIILRLTWLSLPANRCEINLGNTELTNSYLASHLNINTSSNSREDSLLLKYETTMESLTLVKDYLIKFDKISSISNNNINLSTIQFAIFYKVYMMNSPTEGFTNKRNSNFHSISDPSSHDSELNQILLSSIIQMAFSCGLHRDPDNFPQLNVVPTCAPSSANNGTTSNGSATNSTSNSTTNSASDFASSSASASAAGSNDAASGLRDNQVTTERFKHTWRKIWYFIVHLDVQQSLTLGAPRLLRNLKDFSDTKLPSASKIDYVRDIKELIIIKNFTLFWQIDLVIISVLNNILNVFSAKNVRKFELDSLIQSLSNLTYAKKSINEVINDLINSGLLTTSEGSVNYQDYTDESYSLPSLEEIISSTATPFNNSSSSTPSSSMGTPSSTAGASPASVSGKKHSSSSDKKFELPHESTTKALFFTKHLTLRMLLYILNYILFTHYEPMGGQDSGTITLTKNYAQQTLNFAMDGYRNCLIFFNNVKREKVNNHSTIFDYVNILLTPHCLDNGHRALQFLVCLTLRSKCGPIGGMKENIFSSNSSGGEDSDSESHSSETNSAYGGTGDPLELSSNMINNIVLDSVADFQLASILISRMQLFQKLTKQISVQYPYAARTSRSTSFFITLLSGTSKRNDFNLTTWKHPKISGFFKNVPSLIMSGSTDQLKRCPVYQDALGFMGPKMSSAPQSTQLPPIRSSYKPITYTNSNIRKLEQQAQRDAGDKRRKLNGQMATPGWNQGKSQAGMPNSSSLSSSYLNIAGMQMPVAARGMGNPNSLNGNLSASNGNNYGQNGNGTPSANGNLMMPVSSPSSVPLPPLQSGPFNSDGRPTQIPRNANIMNNGIMGQNSDLTPNSDDFFVQNSNFGDLFDTNNVMAAINEFNPIGDMGGSNVGSVDNFIQANGMSIGMINQGVSNFDANNVKINMNMMGNLSGNSTLGLNNGIPQYENNNGLSANIYDNVTNITGTMPVGSGGMMNQNMDSGYVPKIEDGFTELQDFTIWD